MTHTPTPWTVGQQLESGVTNMYGARPYLVAEFGLSKSNASAILSEWMKTFGERRAALAKVQA